MSAAHKYGRGTHEAHPRYIDYMSMIVNHDTYSRMPGAIDASGRIRWQVSSGRSTSFYEHYVARAEWWIETADRLRLPGKGKEQERFSVAARLIHPTGFKPCRICGEESSVGYLYVNANLEKRLNALSSSQEFKKMESICEVIPRLKKLVSASNLKKEFEYLFPERKEHFKNSGYGSKAFEASLSVRSKWLSPGFMCNPPDRLDGFHDYCVNCRVLKDPGRFPENMVQYSHDRRAFQWWAEGDWNLADALYNSAGPGVCEIAGETVARVSPDHIGPLACGFKHMPFFRPTCQRCNSAKNRRLRLADVDSLRNFETETGESPASWQVRALWDELKDGVSSDSEAVTLSNLMRKQQDFYLRLLNELRLSGEAAFLATLLSPNYALYDITFEGLDTGRLTFRTYQKTDNASQLRCQLGARTVRIAFQELAEYCEKDTSRRKSGARLFFQHQDETKLLLREIMNLPQEPIDRHWQSATDVLMKDPTAFEATALGLIPNLRKSARHARCQEFLRELLNAGCKTLANTGSRTSR
jgi:Alw26I/Eco31I/Esp3I family type II restriction endonuclease